MIVLRIRPRPLLLGALAACLALTAIVSLLAWA
jgi:hypothetical protein